VARHVDSRQWRSGEQTVAMIRVIQCQFDDRRRIAIMAACVVLSVLVGCDSKTGGRVAVSGSISYDGKPLERGQIVFEPQGPGRMAIAQIVDGRYAIAAERGPMPGNYLVRITAARPTGAKASSGPTGGNELRDVYEQFVPARYNDRSELSVKIEATSHVEHDFDLHAE